MAEYCPDCFEKLDALHICKDADSINTQFFSANYVWQKNSSLYKFVIFAPLTGLLLDFILPFPSSVIHSLILALLGSALAGIAWVAFNYQGQKSLVFYLRNLGNFLITPNLLKIFGGTSNKKAFSSWIAFILCATLLQLIIFTPGNSAHLAKKVSDKIHEASGANLRVDCPKTRLFFYNERIECRVKTGILGLTVPARAEISPILGEYAIKVSLL